MRKTLFVVSLALFPAMAHPSTDLKFDFSLGESFEALNLGLEDSLTEQRQHVVESAARARQLERMESLSPGGVIPAATVEALREQVETDPLVNEGMAAKIASIRAKFRALEFAKAGQARAYGQAQLESNRRQLDWFRLTLRKAEREAAFAARRHESVHKIFLAGAASEARVRELETEMTMKAAALEGCRRKLAYQEQQVRIGEQAAENDRPN